MLSPYNNNAFGLIIANEPHATTHLIEEGNLNDALSFYQETATPILATVPVARALIDYGYDGYMALWVSQKPNGYDLVENLAATFAPTQPFWLDRFQFVAVQHYNWSSAKGNLPATELGKLLPVFDLETSLGPLLSHLNYWTNANAQAVVTCPNALKDTAAIPDHVAQRTYQDILAHITKKYPNRIFLHRSPVDYVHQYPTVGCSLTFKNSRTYQARINRAQSGHR